MRSAKTRILLLGLLIAVLFAAPLAAQTVKSGDDTVLRQRLKNL